MAKKDTKYTEEQLIEKFKHYKNAKYIGKSGTKLFFECFCGNYILVETQSALHNKDLCCAQCIRRKIALTHRKKSAERIAETINENKIDVFEILQGRNLHKTKLKIKCSECGNYFIGTFNYIIRELGTKCNECIIKENIKKTNLDFNKIIDRADAYNMKLLTTKEEYINMYSKLDLICEAHPESTIRTTWSEFRYYCPCKKCTESYSTLEKIEMEILEKHNIYYLPQQTNLGCRYKSLLIFDFILFCNVEKTDIFAIIETNGEQHERPVKFGGISIERAEELFEEQKIKDQIKRDFCKSNNIPLLELRYTDTDIYEKLTLKFLEENGYKKEVIL